MVEHFCEISVEEIKDNPFQMIGSQWMLVTAQKPDGRINTMTASWGGVGVMWGKNVAYVVIRPQRYTKEFIDNAERFSLTFFPEQYKKELGYLGRVSGRDEDKIAKSGLCAIMDDGAPYFAEGRMVLQCKKLYRQEFSETGFYSDEIPQQCYEAGDYHMLYIAEIERVLRK